MKFSIRRFLLLLTVVAAAFGARAAYVKVDAKLDSVCVLMGRLATLKVEVARQAGAPGGFPQFKECPEDGYVSFQGDSIELRRPRLMDSLVQGDKEILRYEVPVQVFDSGYYQLPEILYVSGGDTARSRSLSLKVIPVAVNANDSIAPFAPVLDPDGFSVVDWVPDWIIDWWWIALVIALAVIAFLWAMRRYKKEGSILPPKPLPSPYTQAIGRLNTLHGRKLWENGREKEYFTELTDILRVYLYRRFGINAMEMTSRQIMETLADNPAVKDKRDYMRNILNMADFVKFAKVRPLPEDNVAAYNNALKFVEETRPTPEEEQAILQAEMERMRPSANVKKSKSAATGLSTKSYKGKSRSSKSVKKKAAKKGGAK